MAWRKRWYVLGFIALLYWLGSRDEKAVPPPTQPSPNTSILIKTTPPPAPPVTEPTQSPITAIVTASRVNVRSGPSVNSEPIIQLSRGLQVTVLTRRNGWAQVRAGKFTGWVTEAFIRNNPTEQSPTEPQIKPQSPEFAYVDANRLNVRSGPGTGYQQVWTLKANERVTVIAR